MRHSLNLQAADGITATDTDMDLDAQARLVKALQNPARFPHPVERFQVIETHISWVILTGPYAYKIKKAVNLGFLDFSTLEKRRFYCHEELRLNRRLAPDLYEAVTSISGNPDDPRLDGGGPVIDYAVRMRQFPDGARLDQVSDRGGLTADHIDQIADDLAAFHRQAPQAGLDSVFGTAASIGDRMLQNFEQIEAHCGDAAVHDRLQPLRDWTRAKLHELRDDFELRRREGWIRECHGDLHLANMALIADRVVIFDCLEFADDLRWIDPLSEAAFLYMDLEHRGHATLARRFLNQYLEAANDYQALNLFRPYLVYRALVRAKVAAIAAHQHQKQPERQAAALATLSAYLDRAERYSRPVGKTPLIVMRGLSGSGKSWLAMRLVERLGAVRLRSDVERKRLLGLSPEQATHSGVAEGAYAPEITQKTYRRLQALAYPILDAGFPAIVDATCLLRQQRACMKRFAGMAGMPFVLVDVQAPEAVLRERIGHRRHNERDASEATLAVLEHQLSVQEPLSAEERTDAITVDASREVDVEALGRTIMARG
jgi:aminoglycoside phosphotransferase family enzyme/predicted kinase